MQFQARKQEENAIDSVSFLHKLRLKYQAQCCSFLVSVEDTFYVGAVYLSVLDFVIFRKRGFEIINVNKLGLSWAKLSQSWG